MGVYVDDRCCNYVGVTCVDGYCPMALFYDYPDCFDSKPDCKTCGFYKGCSDCIFSSADNSCCIDEILLGSRG